MNFTTLQSLSTCRRSWATDPRCSVTITAIPNVASIITALVTAKASCNPIVESAATTTAHTTIAPPTMTCWPTRRLPYLLIDARSVQRRSEHQFQRGVTLPLGVAKTTVLGMSGCMSYSSGSEKGIASKILTVLEFSCVPGVRVMSALSPHRMYTNSTRCLDYPSANERNDRLQHSKQSLLDDIRATNQEEELGHVHSRPENYTSTTPLNQRATTAILLQLSSPPNLLTLSHSSFM